MVDSQHDCCVALEVVYCDDDMLEILCLVGLGRWRGQARAYTNQEDIGRFAEALLRFVGGAASAEFVAGGGVGFGLVALRFYRVDGAGHIAGHVRLASGDLPVGHRPEEVTQLAAEFGTETWSVQEFARELAALSSVQAGRATLRVERVPS